MNKRQPKKQIRRVIEQRAADHRLAQVNFLLRLTACTSTDMRCGDNRVALRRAVRLGRKLACHRANPMVWSHLQEQYGTREITPAMLLLELLLSSKQTCG